jgi:hypothetical protein
MLSRGTFLLVAIVNICGVVATFVAAGYDKDNFAVIFTSLDASPGSWTRRVCPISGFSTQVNGVGYSSVLKMWTAVGYSPVHTIATSVDDGVTWIGLGNKVFTFAAYGVGMGQGKIVTVGFGNNSIATSTDGVTFIGQGISTFGGSGTGLYIPAGNNVAYSEAQNRWVAVGCCNNQIATSVDALSWTPVGNAIFSGTVSGLFL